MTVLPHSSLIWSFSLPNRNYSAAEEKILLKLYDDRKLFLPYNEKYNG